jgi:hypothetical protein
MLDALEYFGDTHPSIPLLRAHGLERLGHGMEARAMAIQAAKALRQAGLEEWALLTEAHFLPR